MKKPKKLSISRHPIITGALILTVTGFITRIIGFFYRIYLSRLFGEEGMGIYQLISPVLALSFSLCAAGYQTALSKLVAEQTKGHGLRPLFAGLSITLPLSTACGIITYHMADFIAANLLMEPRCTHMLRILAFSFPPVAVHACINGYFYGHKRTAVPALSQLLEQLSRVGCVYLLSAGALRRGESPSVNNAVYGLLLGEVVSMTISLIALQFFCADAGSSHSGFLRPFARSGIRGQKSTYAGLLATALPLTANRMILNFLQSVESVSIPAKLRLYGYDTATSLSVYGVLTGMAVPLIYFPNAITGSVAVLLLPTISENYAAGNLKAVYKSTLLTVKYCFLMGFSCMVVFLVSGKWVGANLFNSPLAGHFIRNLSFICPFIYLDTTLSSILQGLGMAGQIFAMNVVCLVLRLCFVFLAVPRVGITGYLWGILAGQLLQCFLYFFCLARFLKRTSFVR